MYNKYNKNLSELKESTLKALENKIIQKALQKNKITLNHLLDISPYSLKILEYPTIQRCFNNKINKFFSKICLKEILEIKNQEEVNKVLKKHQNKIKRNPFFLFLVPVHIHDKIHELKSYLKRKEA